MSDQPDLPLVLVTWNDANVGGDDVVTEDNVKNFHKPTIIHTLGWLVRSDDVGLTVVNEYYDDAFRGRTFVPAGMVIDVQVYKLAKPRGKGQKQKTESPGSQPHTPSSSPSPHGEE
jgi:hypothetical protein